MHGPLCDASAAIAAGGLFGPEFMGRLALDPQTRPLLDQPDFVAMLQDLGRNPNAMSKCAPPCPPAVAGVACQDWAAVM